MSCLTEKVRKNRRVRYLRALARTCLTAVEKIVEVRGGVMLAMSISTLEAPDKHAGLRSIDNIDQIEETWELQRDVVAERLRQGHALHGLVDHGDLCGHCWVSRAGSSNDVFFGRRFKVPESAVYIWDCATLPRYRNRGYYKTVLKGIQSLEPGITSAYVAVDQCNRISRRALESVGFRVCFRYWGIRFLRRHAVCIALWGRKLLTLQRALTRLTRLPLATADKVH